jgi:hypothetical protein
MLRKYFPGFALLNPGYEENKRKQNAARRMPSDVPRHTARLALIAARSPDGVPPRYLRPRTNAAA